MKLETSDYTIDCDPASQRAVLAGVLRLASPSAYEEIFESIRAVLSQNATGIEVDVSRVTFMNSSGVTALSRLVLLARKENKPMALVGADAVAWQRKTIPSLKKLYEKLEVRLG